LFPEGRRPEDLHNVGGRDLKQRLLVNQQHQFRQRQTKSKETRLSISAAWSLNVLQWRSPTTFSFFPVCLTE